MAHYAILRTRLADLADENGVRDASNPAAVTAADIARLLDDVTESVDASALDEAVRSGACALVDFQTAVDDGGSTAASMSSLATSSLGCHCLGRT